MKILVIDDTKKHLDAALQTLTGHDVSVCATHDEAIKLLHVQYNEDERTRLRTKYEKDGLGWMEACDKSKAETLLPFWDVVLCDLLMPAGRNAQGSMEFVGKEMAIGWSLALQAVQNGAKFVAVVTDMNHHAHPASAMLDAINFSIFEINGAKMLMTNHNVEMVGIAGTECTCTECRGSGKSGTNKCWHCNGTGKDFSEKGKDWNKILARLMGTHEEY